MGPTLKKLRNCRNILPSSRLPHQSPLPFLSAPSPTCHFHSSVSMWVPPITQLTRWDESVGQKGFHKYSPLKGGHWALPHLPRGMEAVSQLPSVRKDLKGRHAEQTGFEKTVTASSMKKTGFRATLPPIYWVLSRPGPGCVVARDQPCPSFLC